ncbi:MAG: adenylate/guanylate cyclase domain-containing protein [Methylacidiphilales bacterium]|nr:adenylate/guanylate cyclase domain-containing protein [Candidatus Methylacidiphilales bacterium]
MISSSVEIRQAISRLLARFFVLHLAAELAKPDAVLLEVHKYKPVRQITAELLEATRHEFGINPGEEPPPYNLFERWTSINGKFDYEDSGFFAYNRVFIMRLIDLREGTAESRQRVIEGMAAGFGSFDYEKEGFSVSFFLDSENVMRELLRQAVREFLPQLGDDGDQMVLMQSRAYQTAMYEYFEGLLKNTLAENVRLLHGILPQQVASELKQNGFVQPVHFPDAAVIFTDFERFSVLTADLAPSEVLRRLDVYFSEFDQIAARHGLEKIKTIGDSYMAVAGVPEPRADPVRAACDAALEIRDASDRISGPDGWKIRIGIHVGPLMAGVIGKQKFSYDVWGATVNFASRMESSGEPGQINVSAEIHARAEFSYRWETRGQQPVKRLGSAEMFFLLGKR